MVEVDYYDPYEGSAVDPVVEEEEEFDETGTRNTWAVLTWIMLALTIVLNLVLIGILVVKRNLRSITNKSELNLLMVGSCAKKYVSFCSHRSDITSEPGTSGSNQLKDQVVSKLRPSTCTMIKAKQSSPTKILAECELHNSDGETG